MKTKLFFIVIAFTLLAGCSSDDSSGSINSGVYLPLAVGNYWTYDVTTDGLAITNRDSLYISNDTVINTKTYKKFKTLNIPFGFYSNSLRNNGVRKENDALYMSGNAGLNLGDVLPIDLSVTDLMIFKESATANQELGSVSGVINQDFQGYPLVINYTLKTTALETLPTFSIDENHSYTDVKKVKTTLNLRVSTTVTVPGIPIPLTVALLNTQDVVSSTQYYAKNIGMVYANTILSYELQDFSSFGITLPIPQSGSQTQNELLDNHLVNN
ncbi:hypothetical protein [Flavobacterium sangjuense]|uniref:Lipoprotein n=1 Tax=Flavobacterium sangjuense TaxID=2518177 RepID=A0A4P7PX59_9FLAO|nr:hypothetical protein [Flavobacterium sangjuense]QBZ98613.1 hypothetical protein GS03_02122 [Flavobacterium sangjuense]